MFQVLLPLSACASTAASSSRGMHERGIGVGVHYPAMHLFSSTARSAGKPGDFPHAERIGAPIVTLPLFPAMADADVDRVCDAVADVIRDAAQR